MESDPGKQESRTGGSEAKKEGDSFHMIHLVSCEDTSKKLCRRHIGIFSLREEKGKHYPMDFHSLLEGCLMGCRLPYNF